jgi:hypothetical protein
MENRNYVTTIELRKILKISAHTGNNWVKSGQLPMLKKENKIFVFDYAEVCEHLGVQNLNEDFITALQAQKILGLTYPPSRIICISKNIPYHRFGFKKGLLRFRKWELVLYVARTKEILPELRSVLNKKVTRLNIKPKIKRGFGNGGIETLYDLCRCERNHIKKFSQFGPVAISQIDKLLADNGLTYGMKFAI